MSNQYEEYATKVTDNDILLLKKVIDTSYLQVKHGEEILLQDVLNNFNILCSEMFDLTESQNAFLYAVILKMSEFTEFKLPKVISFLNISDDESNLRRRQQFTWYTRLEMIHEYVYYHHLYRCFYEFNTLNTAFYFMRLQYAHQMQYKKMTYYDSSQLKKSKWTVGEIKDINKMISSSSSSSSSGGGSNDTFNNQKQPSNNNKSVVNSMQQNTKNDEQNQEKSDNNNNEKSQFSAFESNPSFSDKVDKMKSYLQQLADNDDKISKTLSKLDDAVAEAFQNATDIQQQKLQESQQFALYSKNNASIQNFKHLQEHQAEENSICGGLDDFPAGIERYEASQIENDELYKSVKPVIEDSGELSKKEKQSFLEFMDGLLYAGSRAGKRLGELSESLQQDDDLNDEQDEMHEQIIQEIKRQERASKLRIQSLQLQSANQSNLNNQTSFLKSQSKDTLSHVSGKSSTSQNKSPISTQSQNNNSEDDTKSDSEQLEKSTKNKKSSSLSSQSMKENNIQSSHSSGSSGPKKPPKYDLGLNAGTLTKKQLDKTQQVFGTASSSSNVTKSDNLNQNDDQQENLLSDIVKSISCLKNQISSVSQKKSKHPPMVQDSMSNKLSKLLQGGSKPIQDSPIQMKQNLDITEYSSYHIIDPKRNQWKYDKHTAQDQISTISVIEKPTTAVLSPEERELENRLKLEILSQNLTYVGQQLQNQSLFIGFIQWRQLTKRIVQFKVNNLRRTIVAIVSRIFCAARDTKKQQDHDYEILRHLEYKRRKQRGITVIKAFREFYRQQRPDTFFENGDNAVVKYFAENFQLQLAKAYYKLITDKLNEKVSSNEALRIELEKKYYKQVKAYQYVKPDPQLYQQIQSIKEKVLTNLQSLRDIKIQQQKVLTKHQKITTLTVAQFNKYKQFKNYIELFTSTAQMTVKIADRQIYEFYKKLEDFLNKNLIILCKQYMEQQRNLSRSVVNIPSVLGSSLSSQEVKTLFQDITKENQVHLLQQIQGVPLEVLKLGVFQLLCKFIKSHMYLGHQLIPASQYSLRRPIDYLNLMIFSFRYQNYSKQIFFSVLKFLRDVNQCKVSLLIQRRFMKKMRTYAIIRKKATTVQGYVDVIYEQKIKQYVMKLLLDELYERQFLEEFWQKRNQNLLKKIFKLMKSYVKEVKLGGTQFITKIDGYYEEKIKSKVLTTMVNQYVHITISAEKIADMHAQITKFASLNSLVNAFKAEYYHKQLMGKRMGTVLQIMMRKRYLLSKKSKQLQAKTQLQEKTILTRYCLHLLYYRFNTAVNSYAKISKKYKKEVTQQSYLAIKHHYLEMMDVGKRIQAVLLLFSVKKTLVAFKRESAMQTKVQQHIATVGLRRLFNLFGMWRKVAQLRQKQRNEIFELLYQKHVFREKRGVFRLWHIAYFVVSKNRKIKIQKLEKIFSHWKAMYEDRKQFLGFMPVLQNINQCMRQGPEIIVKNNYKKLHPIQVCRFLINNYLNDEFLPKEATFSHSQYLSNTVTRFDMQMEDLFDENKYLKRKVVLLFIINRIRIQNLKHLAIHIKYKYIFMLKMLIFQQLQIQSIIEHNYNAKNKMLLKYVFRALTVKRYELTQQYSKLNKNNNNYLQSKYLQLYSDAFQQRKKLVDEFQSKLLKLYQTRIIAYFKDSIYKYTKHSDKIMRERNQKMLYQTLKTMKKKYMQNNTFYTFIDQLNEVYSAQILKRYFYFIKETTVNRIADRFYFKQLLQSAYSNICAKYQYLHKLVGNIKQLKLQVIFQSIKIKKLKIQHAEQQFEVSVVARKQIKLLLRTFNTWKIAYKYSVIQHKLERKYENILQLVTLQALKKEMIDTNNMKLFIQLKEQNIQRILVARWRKVVNLNTMSRLQNKKLIFSIAYNALQYKYTQIQKRYQVLQSQQLKVVEKFTYAEIKSKYNNLINIQIIIVGMDTKLTQRMYYKQLLDVFKELTQKQVSLNQKLNDQQTREMYQQLIIKNKFNKQVYNQISQSHNDLVIKNALLPIVQYNQNLKLLYNKQYQYHTQVIFAILKKRINNIQHNLPIIEQKIILKQNQLSMKLSFNSLIQYNKQLAEKEEQCTKFSQVLYGRYVLRNIYVMHRLQIIGNKLLCGKYFKTWDKTIKKYKAIKQQQLSDRLCQQFIYKHNLWQLKHIYLSMSLQYKKICEMTQAADNFYKKFCLKQWYKSLLEHQKQNGSMSRWELMQKSITSSIVNE